MAVAKTVKLYLEFKNISIDESDIPVTIISFVFNSVAKVAIPLTYEVPEDIFNNPGVALVAI